MCLLFLKLAVCASETWERPYIGARLMFLSYAYWWGFLPSPEGRRGGEVSTMKGPMDI